MENIDKAVIVSTGKNGWYSKGVSRLENSLIHHGFAGRTMFWKDEYPPNSPTHEENPYAFKIFEFEAAMATGAKVIMHLDSSFWCIKNPHPIFDLICDKGVVGFRTGYNMAQTSSDAALEWAGFTRDEAERLPEIASGLCGLRMDNPDGKKVFEYWKEGMQLGLFKNSRTHDIRDSADPRFIHARQDQTIWGLAIHRCGLHIDDADYVAYYNGGNPGYNPDKCTFFIGGL
jgi:hypothetical protein